MPEGSQGNPPNTASKSAAATPAVAAPVHKPAPQPWECALVEALKSSHGEAVQQALSFLGQNYLLVNRSAAHAVIQELRDAHGFNVLTDITAVHYPKDELAFEMVWTLYSMPKNEHVRVKARFAESDTVRSVTPLWRGADWMEREVFDLFGMNFSGHPNLKRILMPEGWKGHPLRKDYGLKQQDKDWVRGNLGIESGQ